MTRIFLLALALSSLIRMIAWDWIKSKSKNERDIMIRCAQNARLIIMLSYFVSVSSLIVLIVAATLGYSLRYATNITDDTRKLLPLQGYHIYDTSTSPQFELTFLVQCISLLMAVFSYTSTDNLLGLLVFHVCGQLENLTGRLYRMHESKDFVVMLKINVLDHVRLIRSRIGRVPVYMQLTMFAPYHIYHRYVNTSITFRAAFRANQSVIPNN